jgi:heat shock protein HslJ
MTASAACVPSAESPEGTSTATKTAPDESSSELGRTEWVLTSFGDREIIPYDIEITLNVEDDSPYTKFGGRAACNVYGGRNVATEDGVVEINGVESSAVGCGVGDSVERVYFDALTNAATYRIEDGSLMLRDRDGETILIYDVRGREDTLPDSGGEHED